jgi:hypothetical protein
MLGEIGSIPLALHALADAAGSRGVVGRVASIVRLQRFVALAIVSLIAIGQCAYSVKTGLSR